MFDLLWEAGRIDHETIGSMKAWKHSGFSIHNAVRLEAEDHAGLQRLIEYIARSPFSQARFVTRSAWTRGEHGEAARRVPSWTRGMNIAPDGRVFYRAGRAECIRFPALGQEEELAAGMRRNYEVFDPLDFLAAVVQHIPNKGEHTLRYYGFYSNKSRGVRARRGEPNNAAKQDEPLTPFELKQRLTWAALIKCVYEVDPLECPQCQSPMKIVGFVERDQKSCIREILTAAGMWQDAPTRGPPPPQPAPALEVAEPSLDYDFFENCPD